MAFQYDDFNENEKREYTLTMWPINGDKIRPNGGIIDRENDIRLFCYGNGPAMEPCDEYQFIFDYKGTAMNLNIREEFKDNKIYYTLLEVEGNGKLEINEMLPALRGAIILYGNYVNALPGEDISDTIIINF